MRNVAWWLEWVKKEFKLAAPSYVEVCAADDILWVKSLLFLPKFLYSQTNQHSKDYS